MKSIALCDFGPIQYTLAHRPQLQKSSAAALHLRGDARVRRHLLRAQLSLHLAVALRAPSQKPTALERQPEALGDETKLVLRVVGIDDKDADVAELAATQHVSVARQNDTVFFRGQI
jgi:hypothetical protein